MAGQIRITPDDMREIARKYNSEAEEVSGVIDRMDGLFNNLQSEWEGQASQAYAQRYTELRPGFVSAKDLIVEIANALNSVATQLAETDSSIANALRG